jgi:hypothetical protein
VKAWENAVRFGRGETVGYVRPYTPEDAYADFKKAYE